MSRVVLALSQEGDAAARAAEERARAELAGHGAAIRVMPHLYHLPETDRAWDSLRQWRPTHVLSWLQPRAMAALLARHTITGVACSRVDEPLPPSACLADDAAQSPVEEGLTKNPSRWYPVLDKSRCQECRHCLDFCLFGVYEIVDDTVIVAHPDHCKPGCPACARICASSAIIFPLYDRDAAISGAPGIFVNITDDARALYEKRTGQPLPPTDSSTTPTPVADELDRLVSDLEAFARGRRS